MSAAAGADAPDGARTGGRFDDRFLRQLESLALTIRRTTAGRTHGVRRSRRVGAGLEFADHRDYVPGDDLRHLDWNLYGRLERRALRLYEEDEDLSIDLLVDASASMGMGRPPKLDLALQIGAALAYVGLCNLDRVAVTALGDDTAGTPPARGKARILPILRLLDGVRPSGRLPLAEAVRGFLARRRGRRRGLVALISDFYDPAGARAALELVRRQRLEAIAIQLSAPDELAPRLRGDVRICDVETGETRELTISPRALADYAQRHATLLRNLAGYCRERALPFFAATSDQPFDTVVLRMFRAGGLLG
ncbi:MAG TPA: DUF58 domain-containing protein [Polyangia bacterium]|nr:DUF58 domain-containing protein [Polyangia bacterium]